MRLVRPRKPVEAPVALVPEMNRKLGAVRLGADTAEELASPLADASRALTLATSGRLDVDLSRVVAPAGIDSLEDQRLSRQLIEVNGIASAVELLDVMARPAGADSVRDVGIGRRGESRMIGASVSIASLARGQDLGVVETRQSVSGARGDRARHGRTIGPGR